MATEIVKDYLGHPCRITEAFERFGDAVSEARKLADTDPRAVARRIGRLLLEVQERADHATYVNEACLGIVSASGGSAELEAILTMSRDYSTASSNKVYELLGLVLVGLEQGGLYKRAEQGVPT